MCSTCWWFREFLPFLGSFFPVSPPLSSCFSAHTLFLSLGNVYFRNFWTWIHGTRGQTQAPRASGRRVLWRSWALRPPSPFPCCFSWLFLSLSSLSFHFILIYLLCFNIRCCSCFCCCCWLIRFLFLLLRSSFASGSVKSAFIRCLDGSTIDTLMFIAIAYAIVKHCCVVIVIVIMIVIVVDRCVSVPYSLFCWLWLIEMTSMWLALTIVFLVVFVRYVFLSVLFWTYEAAAAVVVIVLKSWKLLLLLLFLVAFIWRRHIAFCILLILPISCILYFTF